MKEAPKKTFTRGNVIVQEIKIGDIHYEYEFGCFVKSEVIELPKWDGKYYIWKSKKINDGRIIDYAIDPEYSHYSVKLYDYEAHLGLSKEI